MEQRDAIIREVVNFTAHQFKGRDHALCIYGSFASGNNTEQSDLDLFLAADQLSIQDVSELKKYIIDLHERFGMVQDDEVPFENKLIALYDELEDAVKLRGLKIVDCAIKVPPIVKTREFLGSYQMRLRLLFNALTTPNLVFDHDNGHLQSLRAMAERNLMLLAISNVHLTRFNIKTLIEALLTGDRGEDGEMYLGYRRTDSVLSHLNQVVEANLVFLQKEGLITRSSFEFLVETDQIAHKIQELIHHESNILTPHCS